MSFLLAVVLLAGSVRLEPVVQAGHHGRVESVTVSRDGKLIATSGDDLVVKLWEASSLRLLRTFDAYAVALTSVAFSPDGRTLATVTRDGTLRLLEVETGAVTKELAPAAKPFWRAVFDPSGALLLTCGGKEGALRLLDARTLAPVREAAVDAQHRRATSPPTAIASSRS